MLEGAWRRIPRELLEEKLLFFLFLKRTFYLLSPRCVVHLGISHVVIVCYSFRSRSGQFALQVICSAPALLQAPHGINEQRNKLHSRTQLSVHGLSFGYLVHTGCGAISQRHPSLRREAAPTLKPHLVIVYSKVVSSVT